MVLVRGSGRLTIASNLLLGSARSHRLVRGSGRLRSSQSISWIVFDLVLVEEFDKLVSKTLLPVMLFLSVNVGYSLLHLRTTDGEDSVAFLPAEFSRFAKSVMDPF